MRSKRIFWILIGDEKTGSARIHGYNVHKSLIKKNVFSKIIHKSGNKLSFKKQARIFFSLRKGDILILQKRKDFSLNKLLFFLKLKRIKIAFVDCDLPICDRNLVRYFDYIICPSKKMTELYKENYPQKNIKYIPDAVEYYHSKANSYNQKAIFFGWLTDERLKEVNRLKKLYSKYGWDVITMSNRDIADIKWRDWGSKQTFQLIGQHTVSIIPTDSNDSALYKSANRVLQSLALGNIVICGDIESYREVIVDKVNGFICSQEEDWVNALKIIADENKRSKIVNNGFQTAQNFNIDKIVLEWMKFLKI